MKVLNNSNIYNVYANSTKVFANNTNVYANTTHGLLYADKLLLIPRKKALNVDILIVDEYTNKKHKAHGLLTQTTGAFALNFTSFLKFEDDDIFEISLFDSFNDDVIYKGKMLITNQQTQKFNF